MMDSMIRNATPHMRLVESSGQTKSALSKNLQRMPEQEMRLMEKLQTSLDIEQLISLFSAEAGETVQFDGIDYLYDANQVALRIGQKSPHHCSYSLKIESRILGDIIFYRKKRFQERELNRIEILLSSLIYPLRNAIQYREALDSAFTDPLTCAQNRAAMNQALIRETELAKRQQTSLSVILLDADHFKNINDTHGHSYGDEVLKAIANITQKTIRQSDVLYRYGGEEFLVLLGQTDTRGAILLAERIRESIAALDTVSGKKSTITVSLGVTTLSKNDSCESLFDRADKALYQAKAAGRNRTVTMTES